MKILHVADLHLSSEADGHGYGLDVLAEVLRLTRAFDVDALLFTGHILDDAGAIDAAVRERLGEFRGPILCVCAAGEPTQHLAEQLAPARVLNAAPFEIVALGEGESRVEIVALPPRTSHADFYDWRVPDKGAAHRILAAHADVLGTASNPTEDGLRPVLDPDIFEQLAIDHAALGGAHIAPEPTRMGATSIHVAGSASVTEAHEPTPREVVLITVDETISTERLPLASAGRFRRYDLWLEFDGSLEGDIEEDPPHPNDHLELRLLGAATTPEAVEATAAALRQRWGSAVRRLDLLMDDVGQLTDPAVEAVARRFDAIWKTHCDASAPESWELARRLALQAIQRKAG